MGFYEIVPGCRIAVGRKCQVTENADKILSQFNLASLPSLPELLLQELDMLQRSPVGQAHPEAGHGSMESLLGNDLFLFARLVAGTPGFGTPRNYRPDDLLRAAGTETLAATIRQSAARLCFSRLTTQRLRFLKQLTLQAILCSALSREIVCRVVAEDDDRDLLEQQAAFCGMFLNIGALVLEQVYPDKYLELLPQCENTTALLETETREFGIDHATLGAALMQQWQVEGFCCDAVRYHHHGIGEILDATTLVKVAWLANQLADEKENTEAQVWADTLFGLQAQAVAAIREKAQAALAEISRTFAIPYSTTRYLPLPATEDEDVLKREKRTLKLLRERVEADNLFATVRERLDKAQPADFGQALGGAVRLLFGPAPCLLFVRSADGSTLRCQGGSVPEDRGMKQLTIRCEAERSVIADTCLSGEAVFRLAPEGLAVVDRQVLSLLGSDNFCCEPVVDRQAGTISGILVTGMSLQQAENYKKQAYLRGALAAKLASILARRQANGEARDDLAAAWEQRIKEAVHEVNNPLGIIKNYLQLLSMKQGEDKKTLSEISFIKSEIDRVSSILEKLKEKPETGDTTRTISINDMVTSLLNVISGSIADDRIRIETQLDAALPQVSCNENAVRQIITNLVKNAAEALVNGGTILVKTAGNFYMNGTRYIQLTVRDNGPGIAAHILDNLFAPGNSSKGGGHTGSGLSIVRSLVEELDGHVSCQTSTPGKDNSAGTEFSVLIPATPAAARNGDRH